MKIRMRILVNLLGGMMIALWLVQPVVADVLLIEEVRERMTRNLPDNGKHMRDVEARWGQPLERRGPVGDPPITRWVYDDYSVYFEHDRVIESVLHHGAVLGHRHTGTTPE